MVIDDFSETLKMKAKLSATENKINLKMWRHQGKKPEHLK